MSKQGTKVKVKTTNRMGQHTNGNSEPSAWGRLPDMKLPKQGRRRKAGDVNHRPALQLGTPSQTGQRAPQVTTASPGRPARFPTPRGPSPSTHCNTQHVLPAHLQPLRVHGFPKARPQASWLCAYRSLPAEPGAQALPPRPKLARDAAGGAGRIRAAIGCQCEGAGPRGWDCRSGAGGDLEGGLRMGKGAVPTGCPGRWRGQTQKRP